MVAQSVNMVAERLVVIGGDSHWYKGQEDGIKVQMSRKPMPATAWVKLNPLITNIFDFKFEDITVMDYQSHLAIKFPAAAV